MCAFFFCCSSLFGAGDLWICLGYRVYILDSSHVVSIHPSPSSLWPLILLIGATSAFEILQLGIRSETMGKRKRGGPVKPKATAGPMDESTGQRSVFPEVVAASTRDSEWRYDDSDNDEAEIDQYEDEDLLGQTFTADMLDATEDGIQDDEAYDEDEEFDEEDE